MSEETKTEIEPKVVSDNLTPVQPAAQIVSFVEIECRVVLHKGMYCLVHAYNSNREKIKIFSVELTTEQYNSWTNDDEMEALILSKCGFTKS